MSPDEKATVEDLAAIQLQFETWDTNVPDNMLAEFARTAFALPAEDGQET